MPKPGAGRTVSDVAAPDLIGAVNDHIPQQVGTNPFLGMGGTQSTLGPDRPDAHLAHQPLDRFAAHPVALATQMTGHSTTAQNRRLQPLLVDQTHQLQIQGRFSLAAIIERRAADQQWIAISLAPPLWF